MKKIKIIEFNKPFLKLLPLFLVILVMVILMSQSYASLKSNYDKNLYIVETGGLKVTFQGKEKDTLLLNNGEGELNFKVSNPSNNNVIYNISLQVAEEYIDLVNYEVYVDDIKKNESSTLTNDNYIVQKEFLSSNEVKNYKIKAWITKTNLKDIKAKVVVSVVEGY